MRSAASPRSASVAAWASPCASSACSNEQGRPRGHAPGFGRAWGTPLPGPSLGCPGRPTSGAHIVAEEAGVMASGNTTNDGYPNVATQSRGPSRTGSGDPSLLGASSPELTAGPDL